MHQDFQTAIKIAQYDLIHSRVKGGKDVTIFDLSNRLARSYSYLCRISSLTEEVPFPSELEVPIMKIKNNFNLLKIKAMECGFILCKIPKTVIKKGDENLLISEYQLCSIETIKSLLNFFQEPTEENYSRASESLSQILSETYGIKNIVDKRYSNQLEIFD
jgi:hypothetical protein